MIFEKIITFNRSARILLAGYEMDRFLIASNPQSGNNQLAVIHTIAPVTIFEVRDNKLHIIFSESDDQEKLSKLSTRAWHWYRSYISHHEQKEKI